MILYERKRRSRVSRSTSDAQNGRRLDKVRVLVVGSIIWIVTAAMSLWFFGVWPRTAVGWVLVLGLGPIGLLLLVALGDFVSDAIGSLPGVRQADVAVERQTAGRQFSGTRVAYYLVRSLLLLIPIVFVLLWLKASAWPTGPNVVAEWWYRHFN
jgi:hypothetical protein